MKQTAVFVSLILTFAVFFACKHEIPFPTLDPNAPVVVSITCDEDSIYFAEQILPLFVSNCAMPDCHDQASHEEGIILDSYQTIIGTGEIQPGQPSEGEIIEVITESDPDDIMPPPPSSPLSNDEIQLIMDWISQGALNNSCPNALCDTLNVTFSGAISPLIETFCTGCHSGSSPQAGLSLTNYDEIAAIANDGSMMGSVNGIGAYAVMPPSGGLSDCQKRMLEIWIENGTPND